MLVCYRNDAYAATIGTMVTMMALDKSVGFGKRRRYDVESH